MRNRFPRLAVLTIIVALVGACAIVPVGRGHDDGYGAAIAVSPAVIAAPFLFWGLRHGWKHGHRHRGHWGNGRRGRGHGGRGRRGRHH